MKKLLIILIFSIVFFLGCEKDPSHVLIINDSSKSVSYQYGNNSDILALSESNTFERTTFSLQPVITGTNETSIISVKMNSKAEGTNAIYTFTDIVPLNLEVINMLPIEIKIKADNFIDDNDSIEFKIDANAQKTTAKIYTAKPNFISLVDYPVIIEWNIINDSIYVIIR